MDRIIEERQISRHHVTILEELMDEGIGYAILVDGVRIAENEPLGHLPAEDELRDILTTHGFR